MPRGAPYKAGLSYFPKLVDFYEDDKIFDLLDRYGPLGVTVYDCILCIVYRRGYYAEIPLDKLSRMVTKMIGNKWVKNQRVVVQVVHFCSEIGLLDHGLMTENIITSVGIQKRFYRIAVKLMKRRLYSDKYWLLGKEENGEPLLNAPLKRVSSEENRINSEENQITSEEKTLKEKENKINIYNAGFPSAEVEREFQKYLFIRRSNYGEITPEQTGALRDDLLSLSADEKEQAAIIRKAQAGGWKSFYRLKKEPQKPEAGKKKNAFCNFHGRDYDADFMKKLAMADIQGKESRDRDRGPGKQDGGGTV